ncbi:hypothetical protein [Rahnella woolbedingensis]|uniref:hypothetical protein n=1 Tax=Rahnella woolbedingensis TaxID=1510574 RepID=UPI001FCA2B0B|nr:hypothetical protein [Rahnella woolbedingensis]
MTIKKYVEAKGRPCLYVPGDHLDYCDEHKYPVLIVWYRTTKADITWINEPYQCSHNWLFCRDDFRQDIEARAEKIYLRYATAKTARAITYSFMTLYDLSIPDARCAADELFDMTLAIIGEYTEKEKTQ